MDIAHKAQAQKIINDLPDDANWEDIIYSLYVREKIEKGLEDVRKGRVVEHEDVIMHMHSLMNCFSPLRFLKISRILDAKSRSMMTLLSES